MMNKTILSACAIAAIVAPAFAGENWSTDLPAALAQAAKENKVVLVDFNGSDWCGPCMMLKSKVFSTPEFESYAKDKFILVDIDMPQGDKITAEQKKINSELCEKYAVSGYPTVLVLNKDGAVLGGFVGGTDKIMEVQQSLDQAISNAPAVNEILSKAASLEGDEKVKALMAAYMLAPTELRANNTVLKAEILANDLNDVSGIRADEKQKQVIKEAEMAVIDMVNGQPTHRIQPILNAQLARTDLPAEQRAFIEVIMIQFEMLDCETEEDLQAFFAKAQAKADSCPTYKGDIEILINNLKQVEPKQLLENLSLKRGKQQAAAAEAAAEAEAEGATEN